MKVAAEGERVLKNGLGTRHGGNKGDLAAFHRNIGSLQQVLDYHSVAKRCLSTTTKESLQGMLNSLKELRPLTNKANARSSGFALEAILMQITLGTERIKGRLERRGIGRNPVEVLNSCLCGTFAICIRRTRKGCKLPGSVLEDRLLDRKVGAMYGWGVNVTSAKKTRMTHPAQEAEICPDKGDLSAWRTRSTSHQLRLPGRTRSLHVVDVGRARFATHLGV